jgi:hypothetical protein
MAPRVWYIGIGGALLLAIGLFALRFPVFIDAYDQWGWQIECGNGFAANLTQAENAGAEGTDVVAACQGALLGRRLWTIPLIAVGVLALMSVLLSATVSHKESAALVSEHDTP